VAVTAYVGEPGSGKTYEVVSEVILPALRDGRRVVSNVRGLNYDEMRAYLLDDEGVAAGKIGELLLVDNEAVKAGFFFEEGKTDTVVQPGDLVVLDECWRWFGTGMSIAPVTFQFFRMHRQYVNAAGVSCDVVLISQSIQDIDRKVKVVVEKHFKMEKYKAFGSKKRYSVEMFNGYKVSGADRVRLMVRKYNPKFFPFYSSYAGKGGDEREVDKRFNIFRSPFFLIGMPLALLLIVVGLFGAARYFNKGVTASGGEVDARGMLKGARVAAAPAREVAPLAEWRAVGYVRAHERLLVVGESAGAYRFVFDPLDLRLTTLDSQVIFDGKAVTGYSGGGSRSILPGAGR
jgi:zona occludens toxin